MLFRCDKCGCVEESELVGGLSARPDDPLLCSECDPEIQKWHGLFPKQQYNPELDFVFNAPGLRVSLS